MFDSKFTARGSIIMHASAVELWAAVSDITRVPQWSPECVKVEWRDGNSPVPGARFVGSNRRGWLRWKGYCKIIESVQGELFSYEVRPNPGMRPQTQWVWSFSTEPRITTSTRVSLFCNVAYYTFIARLIIGKPERRMAEITQMINVTLCRLKSVMESG